MGYSKSSLKFIRLELLLIKYPQFIEQSHVQFNPHEVRSMPRPFRRCEAPCDKGEASFPTQSARSTEQKGFNYIDRELKVCFSFN